MKDEFKWYNSVQFNAREKITENWPSEREAVHKDGKLKPFIGMTVGGKKQISTPIPPPNCDNSGQSNLGQLLLESGVKEFPANLSTVINASGPGKGYQGSSLENSEIRNLKGEHVRTHASQN